jgi:SAM-dependent methyltransferase
MSSTEGAVSPFQNDNFRRLWRRVLGKEPESEVRAAAPLAGPVSRRSNGLHEFWQGMQSRSALQILDLGSASQANINFITGLGYKLYTEDMFLALAPALGRVAVAEPAGEGGRCFGENLNYAEAQFDGVLCWDLFDFLPDEWVKPLVELLARCLKPGGHLLTFFHTGQPGGAVSLCHYRIRSENTLEVLGRGSGNLRRSFNNRSIENLFRRFASLKFYLSRDTLREVVIVR